ncbi:DUF6221 family protein [Actinomadura rubrisoli]|uniref:Uncharacterized protein n=1 Tax=Actinomadura rubrisoli TaxID=2530368 RepID=A0A4R5C5F3_9ACTN|nr:DUF6221 family protein [Actinomadura rubrisoli]TDD93323.1 hypothetical protein E1298_10070 [Actinomadura rubrisoli]
MADPTDLSTADLIALITRGLDQDEARAKACLREVGSVRKGEMYDDGSGPAEQDEYPHYPHASGPAELAFMARCRPAEVLRDIQAKRHILVRCEEELLSGIPRLVHFAEQTLREMARPYLAQERHG